jgi:hypothetical protein
MKRFRTTILLATVVAFCSAVTSASADEATFREIFRDALYGGAAGTLVGAAVMVFTKKPADHLEYMGYGAASGVLLGAAYGMVRSSMALASIDNGSIRIAIPTIIPDVSESPGNGQTKVTWRTELLRGTFN